MHSKIIGTGGYLPAKILSNKDLESIVDTSDEWIVERTGINSDISAKKMRPLHQWPQKLH